MLKGLYLTLMVGTAIPTAVSAQVIESLVSAQVTTASGQPSGFQLTFTTSHKAPLESIFVLPAANPIPLRVILVVTINGAPEVLIDGVVTNTQLTPGGRASPSTLSVTGQDLTAVMSYIDTSGLPYPAMPVEARVALILAKYAVFGVIPLVIPTLMINVPNPTSIIPRHQGDDLAYVESVADAVGYVFYIDPGPAVGTSVAYWGPEIRAGAPQPALNVDMDAETNIESLNFQCQFDKKVLPILMIQNLETKIPIPIPIPDVNPLRPPLGAVEPPARQIRFINDTSKLTAVETVMLGMSIAAKSADGVTASGSLDVLRYGRVLKARKLVGVRGAGTAFDGLYFVKSVTHNIKNGEYKQNFTLVRNGLVSTLGSVPA